MFTAASFQSWGCFGAPCWAFFHGLCHRGCSCVLEGVSHFQREQDSSASGTCSSQLSSGATFSQRPSHLTHSWRNCTIAQCRTCRAVEASGGESHETITAGTAVGSCVSANISQVPGQILEEVLLLLLLWDFSSFQAVFIWCHCCEGRVSAHNLSLLCRNIVTLMIFIAHLLAQTVRLEYFIVVSGSYCKFT